MTKSIKQQLHAATSELLTPVRSGSKQPNVGLAMTSMVVGLVSAQAIAAQNPGEWTFRNAVLFYQETDRVQAIEPVLSGVRYFDNDRSLSAKLVVDVLTGASANGAVPSDQPQTFTRPSGNDTFTTNPDETPLDDTFHDTRYALSLAWDQPLMENLSGTFGINASAEYDYLSLGASSKLSYDFNRKNSTLSLGLSFSNDTIEPEGGLPTAGAEANYHRGDPASITNEFDDHSERDSRAGSDDKIVTDLLLGFTQIIDRKSLMQFNYALSQSSGYMTDPFKFVSVVDPNSGQPERQLYENRPDSRSKQALYAQYMRNFRATDVLDLSYRYMWDDWGMTSHTVDMRYRVGFASSFIEPHVRYYQQQAVDFYTPFLIDDGDVAPVELSADYRVGDLSGITLGLEFGQRLKSGSEWRVAAEYYLQSSKEPAHKPGQLANQEVNPDVDAIMLRVNYDFDW